MRFITLLCAVAVGALPLACGGVPTDGSPAWDLANRYSIEMITDCNPGVVGSSIGLSGCAFKASEIYGNLRIVSLWGGSLTLTSAMCKNFSLTANSTSDNIVQLKDMYTNASQKNCTFAIERSIVEAGITADRPMIGRFGIKIIRDNEYFKKLKFKLDADVFDGMGWYQRKTATPASLVKTKSMAPAVLTIMPTGKTGIMTVRCGADLFLRQAYSTSPFNITIDSPKSCDFEMEVTNSDNYDIEEAMFMYEVSTYTVDLTVPSVGIKSKKITFTFNDKDLSGGKAVVVGVQIDKVKCAKTNKCTVPHTKDYYVVKGLTPAGRLFWGKYTVSLNKWETK